MEIASIVANVVVPGMGDMVLQALGTMFILCKDMKECDEACLQVCRRLDYLYKEVAWLHAREHGLPDAVQTHMNKYAELVISFRHFLERHTKSNVVVRLAKGLSVMDKVKEYHDDIDTVIQAMRLAQSAELMDWRDDWERHRQLQVQRLDQILENNQIMLSELKTQGERLEALTSLMYARRVSFRRGYSMEQRDHLRMACTKIAAVHNLSEPELPRWFVPAVEIVHNPEAFASGSFGTVHRGEYQGADVVVKRLLLDTVASERDRVSFCNELDVWTVVHNHPNVLRVFCATHVSSPAMIVTELAHHGSLDSYLEDNRHHKWKLLYEASCGLLSLHERGVVHGNLKCSNILVGEGVVAKISDFGFHDIRSRFSCDSASNHMQQEHPCLPSPLRWQAPELLKGNAPTQASDVYALGMCILEAVTGTRPWAHSDDATVRRQVRQGHLPMAKGMRANVWGLVQLMCTSDPDKRLPIKEVARQLKLLARDEATLGDKVDQASDTEESDSDDDGEEAAIWGSDDSDNPASDGEEAETLPPPTVPVPQRDYMTVEIEEVVAALRCGMDCDRTHALLALQKRLKREAYYIVEARGIPALLDVVDHELLESLRAMAFGVFRGVVLQEEIYLEEAMEYQPVCVLIHVLQRPQPSWSLQMSIVEFLVEIAHKQRQLVTAELRRHNNDKLLLKLVEQSRQRPERLSKEDAATIKAVVHFLQRMWSDEGNQAFKERKYDMTIAKYSLVIQMNPRVARAYFGRCAALMKSNRLEEAAADAEMCIELDSTFVDAYQNYAVLLRKLNRDREAVQVLHRAIELAPHNESLRRLLDKTEHDMGNRAGNWYMEL